METEAEQMERFYGSVEKMWPEMKRQMRLNADKGGWQSEDIWDLIHEGARAHVDALAGITAHETFRPAEARQHIIAAVNYLVMAYERLSAEETE